MTEKELLQHISKSLVERSQDSSQALHYVSHEFLLKLCQGVADSYRAKLTAAKNQLSAAHTKILNLEMAQDLTYPPVGCINSEDMRDQVIVRSKVQGVVALAKCVEIDPSVIREIVRGEKPVTERVALGLGYVRRKIGKEFWFKPLPTEESDTTTALVKEPTKPAKVRAISVPNERPQQRLVERNALDATIIHTDPKQPTAKVKSPGPWQQLLDSAK